MTKKTFTEHSYSSKDTILDVDGKIYDVHSVDFFTGMMEVRSSTTPIREVHYSHVRFTNSKETSSVI